jgi:hypothetical protein
MRVSTLCGLLAISLAAAVPAEAQFAIGVGGGVGAGSRGGEAKGTHGNAFVQIKPPILPGLRGDVLVVDAPDGVGKVSLAGSLVMSVTIPVITPYLIAGYGVYGIGEDSSRNGWNLGAGVKLSLGAAGGGRGLFAEYRRHQRIARDLVTVGLTF